MNLPPHLVAPAKAPVKQDCSDFAWQIHATMESWTSRADVKASILLALQGGSIIVALTSMGESKDDITSWRPGLVLVGLAALAIGMCLTAAAMQPWLGSARQHSLEFRANMVYFGHLRLWSGEDLATALLALTDQRRVEMISRQLVTLSRLNWRKYRLLRASVVLTIAGLLALIGAATPG